MKWLLFIALLAGLLLRIPGYATHPDPADNRDDVEWGLLGQSLILDHEPRSWSWSPAYHDVVPQRIFDGTTVPYVHPWLDSPPLFGLLVGGWAVINGERTPDAVMPSVIRWIPILLSLVSLAFLYLLAWRLIGSWAVLAAMLFAVSPWNVQVSHLVEAESLLAPMLLGALLLARSRTRTSVVGLVAICLLAPLVKITGVALGAAMLLLLFLQRRWLSALATGTAAVVGVGLYALYGLAIDHRLFIDVIRDNAARHANDFVAALQFLGSLQAGLGPLRPLHDPFWYLGILAIAATGFYWRDVRFLPLLIPFAVYTLVIAVTGPDALGEVSRNGWYRITLYPLLFIGIAAIVAALAEWGGFGESGRRLLRRGVAWRGMPPGLSRFLAASAQPSPKSDTAPKQRDSPLF